MTERATYATLVGMVAYAAIATDLYLPAIPAMIQAFDATEAQGQLTLSIFMLGMAAGQLIFGPLSDYYGRIPVITAGTALFVATSVGCALASNMEVMWLARLAQGLAAASGPVIARAIVRDRYHGDRAAQVMSMLGAAMAVIPLIAPTVGSWVLVWVHWRATFVALAVFGVLILVGLRTFKESAPAIGEGSIRLIPVLQLFGVCLRNRQFIGFQLCGTATYAAILAYLSTVAYFMRDVFALPPAYFGYAFAASVSGFMAGALLCSRLVMYLGLLRVMTIGIVLCLLAAASQRLLAPNGLESTWGLAISSCLIFFGIGLTSANAAMGAVSLFPRTAGAASAVYGFVHSVIAALVGFVAGILYDGTLIPTANIMLICAAVGVLSLPLTRQNPASVAST